MGDKQVGAKFLSRKAPPSAVSISLRQAKLRRGVDSGGRQWEGWTSDEQATGEGIQRPSVALAER